MTNNQNKDANDINKLSPAELERLAILSEELGEAQQIIGKIIRHGFESSNPFDPNLVINRNLLEKEIGDIQFAINLMIKANDLSAGKIDHYKSLKKEKIKKYLHHQ